MILSRVQQQVIVQERTSVAADHPSTEETPAPEQKDRKLSSLWTWIMWWNFGSQTDMWSVGSCIQRTQHHRPPTTHHHHHHHHHVFWHFSLKRRSFLIVFKCVSVLPGLELGVSVFPADLFCLYLQMADLIAPGCLKFSHFLGLWPRFAVSFSDADCLATWLRCLCIQEYMQTETDGWMDRQTDRQVGR